MINSTAFPLARYRFEWRVGSTIRLPEYAGSMLRGAFGHALRQLACMTKQKDCVGCPLISNCPYPAVFEPPPPPSHALQKFSQVPVPYIIEPPEWGARQIGKGETFSFHVVLIGRALRELPLIILAWRRAFSRGVGAGDGTAELVRVLHCGDDGETEIHRPDTGVLAAHPQEITFDALAGEWMQASELTLHFTTPLRLQKNGHALPPGKLDVRTLLMALARRASLLAEFHANGPLIKDFPSLLAATAHIQGCKQLNWRDWTRYSSRQHQKMALGGAVGHWTISGPLTPFIPVLRLGEWLHVGKEAAFGLGRYTLSAGNRGHICIDRSEVRDCVPQVAGEKEETS